MERRYDILEKSSSRDVDSYHKNVFLPKLEKLPKDAPASAPVSEVELDKSIEKLIAE